MKFNLIVAVAALAGSAFALPSTQKFKQTPLGVPYQGNKFYIASFKNVELTMTFITGEAIQINKKILSTKKIPFESHPAGEFCY